MQTDETIFSLLRRKPEEGMTALIDEYSGLLWTVCCQYLSNTEDVKECINEAFSEFYLHIERFEPDKGSLKGYLAVIARRCAIRRYQENCRWENNADTAGEQTADPFAHLENQDELERALASLDPVDEQILRMKYYDGMTAREIADSLGLPYETVKKRHQRSLKKLLRTLSIGLVIAAILTLLAACAYMVLRYFGFVPGYGVNTNADAAVYVLEEGTAVQGEDGYEFHLEDAYWRDGTFLADLMLYGGSEPAQKHFDVSLSGLDNIQFISKSNSGEIVHSTVAYGQYGGDPVADADGSWDGHSLHPPGGGGKRSGRGRILCRCGRGRRPAGGTPDRKRGAGDFDPSLERRGLLHLSVPQPRGLVRLWRPRSPHYRHGAGRHRARRGAGVLFPYQRRYLSGLVFRPGPAGKLYPAHPICLSVSCR